MRLRVTMSPRFKKLLGTVAILFWIAVYVFLLMRLSVWVLPYAHGLSAALFYAVAGTLWIVPVGLAFPWMHRDGRKKGRGNLH